MANKSPEEISMYKGCSCKLSDDVTAILAYAVHTEKIAKDPHRPEQHARDKSAYMYLVRIDKTEDIIKEANGMLEDSSRLKPWQWKNLKEYTSMAYDGTDANWRGAKWLLARVKKAVSWDDFVKAANGWKAAKKAYNTSASYATKDFIADDGTEVKNILESKEALLKLVGHTLTHKCALKSQL